MPTVSHPMLDELYRPFVAHVVEEAADVRIEYPVHFLRLDAHRRYVKRLMWAATRTEPVGEALEFNRRVPEIAANLQRVQKRNRQTKRSTQPIG